MNTLHNKNGYDTKSSNYLESKEFERYVVEKLKPYGYEITLITDDDEQILVGESVEGYEIKYDKRSIKSPNIYIEIAEKSNPRNRDYYPSGIYQDDNSHTYIIGNKDKVYIFNKKYLQNLIKGKSIVETPTSRGVLLTQFLLNTLGNECVIIDFTIDDFWLK